MYVLFSLTALCIWGLGCEQRPELGKSVELHRKAPKRYPTSPEKTTTENKTVAEDKSKKNEVKNPTFRMK